MLRIQKYWAEKRYGVRWSAFFVVKNQKPKEMSIETLIVYQMRRTSKNTVNCNSLYLRSEM